jgi:sugar phosphate isomerase/epimerase
MKTSTEIESIARLVGEEKAVEYVAKAGFDAWDFSMFSMCRWNPAKNAPYETDHPLKGNNYLAFARTLKQIGLDNGIVCNQSHAPFPSDKPQMFDNLMRSIECTAEAGGEICVIHPAAFSTPQQNAEMYGKLLPFAKAHKVKIATENMWDWDTKNDCACFAACATPESFNAHLDAVNDVDFVACLDIGHAEMMGEMTNAVEMIKALGNRLQALHIHDNDLHDDCHQIPFSMKIDFDKVANALREIDYKGYLTLECNAFLKMYTQENVFDGVKKLAESVKRISRLIF